MNTSKWFVTSLAAATLTLAGFSITGCQKSATEGAAHARQYTCPMHPEVVKDAMGDCPKCGMKLVEKK